jgi:hypothetical protein
MLASKQIWMILNRIRFCIQIQWRGGELESSKQDTVADSRMEVEYNDASEATKEVV